MGSVDDKRILMLMTKLGLHRNQVQNQQRAESLLRAKGLPYEVLDGADVQNRDARNELFKLSGQRGVYPQFFMLYGEERIEFLGDWDKIEALNDASGLPREVLEQNPEILTWERIMGA